MSISTINSISFKGNSQQTNSNQKAKKTGGIVPAIASLAIPGLGQFINNDNKTGIKFLGGSIALLGLNIFSTIKHKPTLALATGISGFVLAIASAENAYKGKKAESNNQTENKVDTQA